MIARLLQTLLRENCGKQGQNRMALLTGCPRRRISVGSSLGPYRTHLANLDASAIGQQVSIAGWLQAKRVWKSGPGQPLKPAFLLLRDESGELQLTIDPADAAAGDSEGGTGSSLSAAVARIPVESCIAVRGVVRERPQGSENTDQRSGSVELVLHHLEVLNMAPEGVAPPLQVAAAIAEDKSAHSTSGGARGKQSVTHRATSAVAGEDARLAHRYLDLRRPLMQRNLRLRAAVIHAMRRCLAEDLEFVEVETPTLFASTPEGAREFLVPTRTPGRFYALTQSPQQHKQTLMAGGVTRYFQVARCYRDEGGRADRQPEFTQLDLEMAFAGEDEVQATVQAAVDSAIAAANACSITLAALPPLLPTFCRTGGPGTDLPTVSYADCMLLFGSDRPLRRLRGGAESDSAGELSGRAFLLSGAESVLFNARSVLSEEMVCKGAGEISDALAMALRSSAVPDGAPASLEDLRPSLCSVQAVRLPGLAAGLSRKGFEALSRDLSHAAGGAGASCRSRGLFQVVRVAADGTWKGSALGKALSATGQRAVSEAVRAAAEDVVVVAAGFGDSPYRALGATRAECAARLRAASGLTGPRQLDMFWVTQFPLFEVDEVGPTGADQTPRLTPAHHPFTAPLQEDMAVMRHACDEGWSSDMTAERMDRLACVRARSYDLVCDGIELGGGSVRLHRAEDQEVVFATLQLPAARVASFGHLLRALRWGAPPHAGLAIGLDRFVAMLAGAESLRDVIAFPKTAGGQDLFSSAPSQVPEELLEEYSIAVRERA